MNKSICKIFHRSTEWFFDQNIVFSSEEDLIEKNFEHIQFEPNFLLSKDILENAIPALLSTTGTTGRMFAHILIRSYQEKHKNLGYTSFTIYMTSAGMSLLSPPALKYDKGITCGGR